LRRPERRHTVPCADTGEPCRSTSALSSGESGASTAHRFRCAVSLNRRAFRRPGLGCRLAGCSEPDWKDEPSRNILNTVTRQMPSVARARFLGRALRTCSEERRESLGSPRGACRPHRLTLPHRQVLQPLATSRPLTWSGRLSSGHLFSRVNLTGEEGFFGSFP